MNKDDIVHLNTLKEKYLDSFKNCNVLELGSRNINGSVRECFDGCQFTGVDWIAGEDVDVVEKFHETKLEVRHFDTLISYSSWEHDPYWIRSISHNLEFLKFGGLIVFNWAGRDSSPHGLFYSADIEGEPTGAVTGTDKLTGDEPVGKYYPKDIVEMEDFLKTLGVKILESGELERGTVYVVGQKNMYR